MITISISLWCFTNVLTCLKDHDSVLLMSFANSKSSINLSNLVVGKNAASRSPPLALSQTLKSKCMSVGNCRTETHSTVAKLKKILAKSSKPCNYFLSLAPLQSLCCLYLANLISIYLRVKKSRIG